MAGELWKSSGLRGIPIASGILSEKAKHQVLISSKVTEAIQEWQVPV